MSSALTKVIGARLATRTPSIFTRTFMLGIVGTLAGYLTSWENADRMRDHYLDKHMDSGDTFDFVIVGGGTAGVILANRLSEKYKTLLIEAGGEPHPFQTVPLLSNFLMNYPELDWRHITMPQKQGFLGSIQSRASISQGRGLGGTSNMDFLMYLRGHSLDYDNWGDILQDESWSYKSIAKYFKSLEQYSGPWRGENHGKSGPMKVKQSPFTGLGKQFCHAAQQNGYKHTDLNDIFTEGCDILTYPSRKGYRDSVFSSFYKPAKNRGNLIVHKFGHVNKILIREEDSTAYAVEYDRHGKSRMAYAKKEIVVTAGAIQTPKILMLSGIGPKSDLDALGIPVIADLPVGSNLQDHPSVFLGPFFVDRGKSLDIDRDVSGGAVLQLAQDKGPLTTTGFQAAAVISSGLEKLHGSRNWPDLQLTMYGLSHHKSADEDFSQAFKLKKELLKKYLEHSKGRDSFSILVSVGRPKSTGTVKPLNRNPYAPLIIDPGYFEKIYDVVVMVDGVKKALRLVENSTVFHNELHTRFTDQVLPGCEKFRFRSDAYFECFARTLTVSLGNVAGTAALGSVLNSKMQVKGVKALRVMDASVMPSIVSTSTGGAVMMIAEKGAELLLQEWKGSEAESSLSNSVKPGGESPLKVDFDSNALIDAALKLGGSSNSSLFKDFDLDNLSELTKTVGDLASLLDPIKAADSIPLKSVSSLASLLDPIKAANSIPLKSVYTGSFDLNNNAGSNKTVTPSPFHAMMTLAPILKSQLGGLYQNYFEDSDSAPSVSSAKKIKPSDVKGGMDVFSKLVSSFKIPILSGNLTSIKNTLSSTGTLDPAKLIQGMIDKNMKDLEELEHIDKIKLLGKLELAKGKGKHQDPKNVTLEDMFGIAEGQQEDMEEYEVEEEEDAPVALPISTEKSVIISTSERENTTKKPYIDYSYEVFPVPMTKSKGVETSTSASVTTPISAKPQVTVTNPVYPKQSAPIVQTVVVETVPIETRTTTTKAPPIIVQSISFDVKPIPTELTTTTTTTTRKPTKLVGVDPQKLKNLEALAQIQHDTLAKLRNKQIAKNRPLHLSHNGHRLPPFRHPALPSFVKAITAQGIPQRPQFSQPPPPPQAPALDMLPPSIQGRFPPPQYYQKPAATPPPPPPPFHPIYEQARRPPLPHHHLHVPSNIRGHFGNHYQGQGPPPVDPTDLKYAVSSIMNAKYTHPAVNPFTGILDFGRERYPPRNEAESDVLKALQLRANVEKLLTDPLTLNLPNPIPITNRPTPPPPPTMPSTRHPPPPPIGLPELKLNPQPDGIFAPLKDALEPLTKLMKAPLSLLPNPFKSSSSPESSSTTSSSLASSLAGNFLPSIFQQRTGPLYSPEPMRRSKQDRKIQSASSQITITPNSLAAALPRFLINNSRLNSDISPDLFLLALANLTTGLPKPFVLEPNKKFGDTLSPSSASSSSSGDKRQHSQSQEEKLQGKKLLDDSIKDILSHLKNHHFASISAHSEDGDESATTGSSLGVNSANEILNIDYTHVSPTAKAAVVSVTPKTRLNPPVEFHKSPWAKEPVAPSKSLHFKIKIV